MPARRSAAEMAAAPSFAAGSGDKAPQKAPMGVRAEPAMRTSLGRNGCRRAEAEALEAERPTHGGDRRATAAGGALFHDA